MNFRPWIILLFLILTGRAASQYNCPDSLIYTVRVSSSQSLITSWDPFLTPYGTGSQTNQSITDTGLIGGWGGLTLLPNISGGTLSPTFYTTQYNTLYYWSGLSWVSTSVSLTNSNTFELGGCGNAIYAICGPGFGSYQVRKYNPPNSVTTILTSTSQIGGDIVCDCNCNFYLFFNNSLKKYDTNGNLLMTYTVSGMPFVTNINTRFAIIGNTIFIISPGTALAGTNIYKGQGTIVGNTIYSSPLSMFSSVSGSPGFAVCPFSISQSISGSISTNTIGCFPTTCSLVVNTSTNQLNYNWSGTGLITPIGNGSVVTVSSVGTYSCHINEGFCQDTLLSLVTSVTANTTLVLPIITPSNNLCFQTNLNLYAAPNGTQYAYTWTSTNLSGSVTTSIVSLSGPGLYSLNVTDNTNGCFGTTTASILSTPLVDLGISSSTLCVYSVEGKDKAILSLNGATNYTLLTSPGFSVNFSPSQPVVLFQTPPYSSNGSSGSATLIGTNGVCTGSISTNFSVLPITTITAIPINTLVCKGATIQMTAFGAESYSWSPITSIISGGMNSAIAEILNSQVFSVVGVDKFGCLTPVQTISVNTFPVHNGRLENQKLICEKECADFKFSPTKDSLNKIYSDWKLEGSDFYNTDHFRSCFPSAGTFELIGVLKDSLHQCENTISFEIKVQPKPKANFKFFPEFPVEDLEEVEFSNSTLGEQQNKWNWYIDLTYNTKYEGKQFSYRFPNSGKYAVALVVQNSWGCSDTSIKVISVQEDFNFYIPNTFTPNDDSRNDLFIPIVRGVKSIHFELYDKWGQKIFFTSELNEGWDGYFKRQACQQDIYTWIIKLSTKGGEEKKYTGHVVLMR